MSCSDKVARWNVLGFQGALLGQFVGPLYLSSVILGSFYHGEHMRRAICTRYGNLENLPTEFNISTPLLSGITNSESRQPGKCPSFAVNWLLGNDGLEIITTMRGKTEQERPSQLCKLEMFKLYADLCSKLNIRNDVVSVVPATEHYSDVKAAYLNYQTAKNIFTNKFRADDMGYWVGKPHEHDEFSLADGTAAMTSMIASMQQSLDTMKATVQQLPQASASAVSVKSEDTTADEDIYDGIGTLFAQGEEAKPDPAATTAVATENVSPKIESPQPPQSAQSPKMEVV